MTISSAIYSGFCASFASLFGKLSGLELAYLDTNLRYLIKIFFFLIMILLNSMVWTFFVKALQYSKTAVEATAVSTAVNYISSGILGFLFFGEVTGFLWWLGVSFVVMGIVIISSSTLNEAEKKNC